MNTPTKAGVAVAASLLIAGGVALVVLPGDKLTRVALAEAGFSDCAPALLECTMRQGKGFDGLATKNRQKLTSAKYAVVRRPVASCKGPRETLVAVGITGKPQAVESTDVVPGTVVNYAECAVLPCRADSALCDKYGEPSAFTVVDFPCAYRPKGVSEKDCTLADGGVLPANLTAKPGAWAGAGCVRRTCTVLAGDDEPMR